MTFSASAPPQANAKEHRHDHQLSQSTDPCPATMICGTTVFTGLSAVLYGFATAKTHA
jgi:hypothetical protein